MRIVIGSINAKLREDKQDRAPKKIEEKPEKKRDRVVKQNSSQGDKTPVAVGHHKVPPDVSPRLVMLK